MSSSLRVYVGVYLEIDNLKENNTVPTYYDSLGNLKTTKFNPNTGEEYKLVNVDKIVTTYPDPYKINVEGFNDHEFFIVNGIKKDTTIWIPNGPKFEIAYWDSDDEPMCVDLININSVNFLDRFKEHYNEYLWELREELNFDYRVNFGLITFYM
jgi:hypothetical protein